MPILGSKFGYIDRSGHFIIPPQFDRCYEYTDGLATVEIEGKYGFIDKNGDFVIPPQFEWALGFSEGRAAVFINGKHGYIDKSATTIIPPTFEEVSDFSDGLAYVQTDTQKGYINHSGAWELIPPPVMNCATTNRPPRHIRHLLLLSTTLLTGPQNGVDCRPLEHNLSLSERWRCSRTYAYCR